MNFFSFGKKKRKTCKKPPAKLIKLAKKYRVKIKVKHGSRMVYKHVSVIKRQIKKRIRSIKRTSRFGNAPFLNPKGYGYHTKIRRNPGSLSQTSSVVTRRNNINRPAGTGLKSKYFPTYGTYARFFTEKVPRVVGPRSIGFMGQPDGSLYAVGAPFYRYNKPNNFGLRSFKGLASKVKGAGGAASKLKGARDKAKTASMIFKAQQMLKNLFK